MRLILLLDKELYTLNHKPEIAQIYSLQDKPKSLGQGIPLFSVYGRHLAQ